MRLIDADLIIEILQEEKDALTVNKGAYRYLTDEEKREYNKLEKIIEDLDSQPTAYDVDKVLDQLEILQKDKYVRSPIICYALEKAIEIVKAGGVNEDH